MAVFGLVFSKLAMLVIAPDPLPFSKDTPADIKGVLYCFDDCTSGSAGSAGNQGQGQEIMHSFILSLVFQST